MEESYGEGVANHTGPASCAVVRKGGGEAWIGVRAGRVLSRERYEPDRGADAVEVGGRQHPRRRQRETPRDPARSKTPCMPGINLQGNREIPRLSAVEGDVDRIGKPKGVRR